MTTQRKAIAISGEIKPCITLMAKDYEGISRLARAAATWMPDLVSVLSEEFERAHVLADGLSEQTVCMGSEVEFPDDTRKRSGPWCSSTGRCGYFAGKDIHPHPHRGRADRPQCRRFHHLGNTDGRNSAIDRP